MYKRQLYRWAASRGGVFVNPALTEPFGLTLLEASSCGLPIISTNDGGPKEIRSKCENGLLVDVTDINELKVILEKGISNNNQCKIWSRNGIEGVLTDTLVGTLMYAIIYQYLPKNFQVQLVILPLTLNKVV